MTTRTRLVLGTLVLLTVALIVAMLNTLLSAAPLAYAAASGTETAEKLHGHIFVDWSKHAVVQQNDGVVTCPTVSEPGAACTTGPSTVDFEVNIIGYTPNGWFDISANSLQDQCTLVTFTPISEFFGDTPVENDLGDIHLNPHGNLHIHGHAENCVDGKYSIDVASDVFDGRHLSVSFHLVG